MALIEITPLVVVPWQASLPNPDLVIPSLIRIGRTASFLDVRAAPVAQQLNQAAAWPLGQDTFTHLVCLDTDHIHPDDIGTLYEKVEPALPTPEPVQRSGSFMITSESLRHNDCSLGCSTDFESGNYICKPFCDGEHARGN